MIIILVILTVWVGQSTVNMQGCPIPVQIPCTSVNQSHTVIAWSGTFPNNCMMIQYDNISVVYNPLMINTIWITLTNTDNNCPLSVSAKAQSIANIYNLSPTGQRVLILNITTQYLRIVVVPNICTNCTVNQNFEWNPPGLALYPAYFDLNQLGPYCLNNGTPNPSYTGAGYNCTCPGRVSVYNGPSCEYTEGIINRKQIFMNVFSYADNINMQFSLFSNGIIGTQSILTIKGSNYQKIVEILIIESSVVLKTENTNTVKIDTPIDNQNWHDFTLVLNRQSATLRVNANPIAQPLTTMANANFNSFYLVLNDYANITYKICMQNLIINSRIIDLNSPGYASCCMDRCDICPYPLICKCRPFQSSSFTTCYCPPGTQKNAIGQCVSNNIGPSQIGNSIGSTLLINSGTPISTLDFGFQTLSNNGNILTLNLLTPVSQVYVQIVNSNIVLNVTNQSLQTLNYNVSNGYQHNVTLTFSLYQIGLILDNNLNYSVYIFKWFTDVVPPIITQITAASLSMGPLSAPYVSPLNTLSTCFFAMQLNTMTTPTNLNPATASNLSGQCSTGPRCNTINCSNGTICNDTLWQNTQCISICGSNYTYVNLSCLPTVCISNPCVNGQCSISSTGSYACNCTGGYTGNNCSIPPTALATLWYIAVIVVLFLLLVIIIVLLVYCCCCVAKRPVEEGIITKINENIVVYNDQAGESDYTGPPINFAILNNALHGGVDKVDQGKLKGNFQPPPDLSLKKEELERNNKDLILDHPLEYGFEGYESDDPSLSPIGSISEGSEINFDGLGNIEIYNDN